MLKTRFGCDRGVANLGWLYGRHSFSFAEYLDPDNMAWGNLRVINEDQIEPGTGFDTHGHRNMEIVSFMLKGRLEHRDNMGNHTVIPAGDVQRMSAGAGVLHSEYNPDTSLTNHFFQIWIIPNQYNLAPGYEQKTFPLQERKGRLCLIASPSGEEDSLTINADARLFTANLEIGESLSYESIDSRKSYIHVIEGEMSINGISLQSGDALKVSGHEIITINAVTEAAFLLFDLAP